MSEAADTRGSSAGALLRAAREKQGLHIAALAAAIKVSPRKLDALEHDRYDELPDATFTRALAQTVCRQLKTDAAPVLALLPQPEGGALDHVGGRLNTPFRDRAGRSEPTGVAAAAVRPMVGAGIALLVAAAAVYFVPAEFWQFRRDAPAVTVATPTPAPAAAPVAASAPAGLVLAAASAPEPTPAASAPVVETVFSAPPLQPPASGAEPPRLVQLRADNPSWVEARDARGAVLLSRTLQPGESVGFDGSLPIRLTIGNAAGTSISFRGQAMDLAAATRDNVARLELK